MVTSIWYTHRAHLIVLVRAAVHHHVQAYAKHLSTAQDELHCHFQLHSRVPHKWTPVNNEELCCQCESGNIQDLHTIAILKDGVVVVHVRAFNFRFWSLENERTGSLAGQNKPAIQYPSKLVGPMPCIPWYIVPDLLPVMSLENIICMSQWIPCQTTSTDCTE